MVTRMREVDELLEYFEKNIDIEKVRAAEKRNIDALCFREVDHIPLAVRVEQHPKFKPVRMEDTFDDPEKMLYNELLFSFGSIYNSLQIGDDFPYQIRANYGVGQIANMFGAKLRMVNQMPWYENPSWDELRKTVAKGIPEFTNGISGKTITCYQYFKERLAQYPVCQEAIHITQPDLEGPFSILELLVGFEIYYALFDDAEALHEILDVVTETYIQYTKFLEPMLTGRLEDNCFVVHGSMYRGGVIVKDDTAAINLSPDMYDEFARPYNFRIYEALGGGVLHHCGTEYDWHYEHFYHPLLKGLNFGQPQFHNLEKKLKTIGDDKVAIVGWGNDRGIEALDSFYQLMPKTGFTLCAAAPDLETGKRIFEAHLEKSAMR